MVSVKIEIAAEEHLPSNPPSSPHQKGRARDLLSKKLPAEAVHVKKIPTSLKFPTPQHFSDSLSLSLLQIMKLSVNLLS